MANKIEEIIVEPVHIETGSTFKIKIKAKRSATYQEIKDNKSYLQLKSYTYGQLKGE